MRKRPWLFCADIGSVEKGRFGWFGSGPDDSVISGRCIDDLSCEVAEQLNNEEKVALGFECPLYVPLRGDPMFLTKARTGEGNRSWSAAAGCGALAIGLVEVAWILDKIRGKAPLSTAAFLDWKKFENSGKGLFLWEAFVSGKSKGSGHTHDAVIAVRTFLAALPNPDAANAISEQVVFSLIGASMLRTGWSNNVQHLSDSCLVIKA